MTDPKSTVRRCAELGWGLDPISSRGCTYRTPNEKEHMQCTMWIPLLISVIVVVATIILASMAIGADEPRGPR